jgi:PKD repeat protein
MVAWAAALVLALLGCWLGAGSAHALVVQLPNGHAVGVAPRAGVAPASISGVRTTRANPNVPDNGNVNYHDGPVVHSSAPYLIFWGPLGSFSASTEALLTRYFTDVAHDSGSATNVYGVARQYTDPTGFADYQQTFSSAAQVIYDIDPYPARDTTNCPDVNDTYYPTCVTDAQLQGELTSLIVSSHLPTDGSTGAGELSDNAPIYFIVTPADVNICNPGIGCSDTTFCAYHGDYTTSGSHVLYAAIDLLSAESADPALSPKECQSDNNSVVQEPNGDGGDVAIKYMSHEDNETITDPLLNAWYDSTSGNEIADNCNATGPINFPAGTDPNAFEPTLGGTADTGTLFDQLINDDQYYIQSVWSNGDVNCRMQPTADALSPSFTVASGTPAVGRPVSFDPSASAPPAGYSSVTWNFGDSATGFTTGNASAQHTYAAAGDYTVTLTAVDTLGNVAAATQTVTVRSPPTATFTTPSADPLVGSVVAFDGSDSSDPNSGGLISSYSWSFGDGATATGPTPSHTYAAPGIYMVQLTVTDNFGVVSSTVSTQLQALAVPTASFAFSPTALTGHAAAFDGTASSDPNSGGSISSYDWSFGDGTTGTGATPSHTYGSPGMYSVQLTVTDNFGVVSASVSRQLQVLAPPTASFTVSPAIPLSGRAVTFAGVAADPNAGGSISSYRWSFGGGATGAGPTASHTYAAPGTYTVKLTVTDSFGLGTTARRIIVVTARGKPTVSHARLSFGKGAPKLSFVLTAGTHAPSLERVVIGLPRGMSFDKKRLAKGVSVKSASGKKLSFADKLGHRRLTITLKRAAGAVKVTIAAITAPRTLGHTAHAGKRKSLKIAVTAIDLAGTQTPLTLKFRVH